jgi:hypothetical protein
MRFLAAANPRASLETTWHPARARAGVASSSPHPLFKSCRMVGPRFVQPTWLRRFGALF